LRPVFRLRARRAAEAHPRLGIVIFLLLLVFITIIILLAPGAVVLARAFVALHSAAVISSGPERLLHLPPLVFVQRHEVAVGVRISILYINEGRHY
jgi:hypothetical protein